VVYLQNPNTLFVAIQQGSSTGGSWLVLQGVLAIIIDSQFLCKTWKAIKQKYNRM